MAWMGWSRYLRPRRARAACIFLHFAQAQPRCPRRPALPQAAASARHAANTTHERTRDACRAAPRGLGAQHKKSYAGRLKDADAVRVGPRISRARAQVKWLGLLTAPVARGGAAAAATQTRSASGALGVVRRGPLGVGVRGEAAADASKKQANKSRFPKGKNLVKDVADWLASRWRRSRPSMATRSRARATRSPKEKFNLGAAFDVANGRRDKGYNGAKPDSSAGAEEEGARPLLAPRSAASPIPTLAWPTMWMLIVRAAVRSIAYAAWSLAVGRSPSVRPQVEHLPRRVGGV